MSKPLSGREIDIAAAKAMGWTGQHAIDEDGLEYDAWTLRQSDGTLYMHGATLATEAECWQYFPPHYSSTGDGLLAMLEWCASKKCHPWLEDLEEAETIRWQGHCLDADGNRHYGNGSTPGEALARAIVAAAGEEGGKL